MSYTKLHRSLLTSSVWGECHTTRIVWVTMLALCDRDGIVEASVPGLAHEARVTIAECEEALRVLSSPDPYSRSKEDDGRRVLEIDGGWKLVTHEKHREKASAEERREKAAERKRRERSRKGRDGSVTGRDGHGSSAKSRHADADADADGAYAPSRACARGGGITPEELNTRYVEGLRKHLGDHGPKYGRAALWDPLWERLAGSLRSDEDANRLLAAFWADVDCQRLGYKPGLLESEAPRLLAQGPKRPKGESDADAEEKALEIRDRMARGGAT